MLPINYLIQNYLRIWQTNRSNYLVLDMENEHIEQAMLHLKTDKPRGAVQGKTRINEKAMQRLK